MSKTLIDRGVALSALALVFILPLAPASAQDNSVRSQAQSDNRGGMQRAERRAQARVERQAERRAQPRAERRAERQVDRRAERRAERQVERRAERPERARRAPDRGGFGSDVVRRAERVQQSQRAERIDRRSERRADGIDRRSERRAENVERRGERRADRLDWQGRNGAANRVERRTERRADRIENRGDRRAIRVEQRGNVRAGRIDRRDGWRDGRRDNSRADRRDFRRDQRNWRRDDWRHSYRGRNGWDNRDFRRWDRGWRGNQRFDWVDYRRANRFHYRPGPYFAPFRSHRYSRLQTGFFLDSLFFQPRFFINDPLSYRLPPVYGPYQWVRYYDDVLLVDIYTGEVVDVINDFFW